MLQTKATQNPGRIGVNLDWRMLRCKPAGNRKVPRGTYPVSASSDGRFRLASAPRRSFPGLATNASPADRNLGHAGCGAASGCVPPDPASASRADAEALADLAGIIAHNLNNSLALILGGLELAQRRVARGDSDIGKCVDASAEGARRAAKLVADLLDFSRVEAPEPASMEVNGTVLALEPVIRGALGSAVDLRMVLAEGPWWIHADRAELEKALLSLVDNARDAVTGGGSLVIETGNASAPVGETGGVEHFVMIGVTDTGSGMTPEVAARAFEPFFTTKGVTGRLGLGLTKVRRFARQCGGYVTLGSAPGGGTTVRVFLPAAGRDAAGPQECRKRPGR